MKKNLLSLALCISLCATNLSTISAKASDSKSITISTPSTSTNSHEKKRYIVMFKDKAVSASTKKYTKKAKNLEKKALKNQNVSIKKIEKITKNKIKNRNAFLVNACSIDATYEEAEKIKELDTVTECYEAFTYSQPVNQNLSDGFGSSWYSPTIPPYEETDSLDGEGTIISIIDTGVDCYHYNLAIDSDINTKFTYEEMQNKIKNLGHGQYINSKVPYAYNYAEDCNIYDSNIHAHGTHVAGIASANPGKYHGKITGIAPNSQILAMQVFSGSGSCAYTDDIVHAIEDSVKLGADVINLSLGAKSGFSDCDTLASKSVNAAYNSGCIISSSAGNEKLYASNAADGYNNPFNLCDTGTVDDIAAVPNTLSVAACEIGENNTKMLSSSSWGPTTELKIKPEVTAPGVKITSLAPKDDYATLSGTSMAAPYVSGVSALVKQSLKNKHINLSNKSLSNFIKCSIMNTSSPLMDYTYAKGTVPYSVRQQGCGLVNSDNAIRNNVIVTCNNKAAIELGSIREGTREVPFTLSFTNYGKYYEKYYIDDSTVYTETTDTPTNKDGICLKEVEYSYVVFPKPYVAIKPGETVTVQGHVSIAPEFEPNQYIESFIHIRQDSYSDIEESIPLTIPLLGFYGNWDNLPIFDEPNGSENCIMDKKNKISSCIIDKNYTILGVLDKRLYLDKSAISLNPNTNNNIAIPCLTQLRNAYSVDVSVVDEHDTLIQKIGTYNYLIATSLEVHTIGNNISNFATWDGTKYDEKTNTTIPVEDGQYYFMIQAKHSKDALAQTYKLPILVDSVAPDIDVNYTYDSDTKKAYFDVQNYDDPKNITNITCSIKYNSKSQIHTTFNFNEDYTELNDGCRRFTVDNIDMVPTCVDVKVKDYAQNVTTKLLTREDFFIEDNENTILPEQEIQDNKIPVVDIISDFNLYKPYYRHINENSYTYEAIINDTDRNVELTFKITDQSNLSSKTPPYFNALTYDKYGMLTKTKLPLNQIDSTTYNLVLSPNDLRKYIDSDKKSLSGDFVVFDEFNNYTIIHVFLYPHENDQVSFTAQQSKAIAMPSEYIIKKELLNSDNTYTLTLNVKGINFKAATINGIDAEIIYPEDYEYINLPSRVVKIKANVPVNVGKNIYTVCLYEDTAKYINDYIYKQSLGTFFYNGDNISFSVNSYSPVNDEIYMCQDNLFYFSLDINSKINAFNIFINNSSVYSYSATDIQINQNKNNIISLPLSYSLEGNDVKTLRIKVVDLCGNIAEKTIKVKPNCRDEYNNLDLNNYKDINNLSIKLTANNTYTGKKVNPTITINDGNYTLVKNVDFKVHYTNNKNIGKAKVKITGINKYKGIVNKTFKIVPKKSSILKVSINHKGKVTIKAKKIKGKVKYEFFYSNSKRGKFKKLGASNDPILVTNKLKSAKTYYIKVRAYKIVKKKKITCKFSKAKKIKL